MTISAFYLFESLYTILFSLSKGKGTLFEKEISIPNWGGHWSYVCVCMFMQQSVNVFECMRVCKEWYRLFLHSGKFP